MRNSTILQRFLTDTKKSDKASKSVWGAIGINVGNNYKPGGTAMVAFGKTARGVIQQGIDDLGRWSWIAFEEEDNKMILIISIYQCCKNPTNPQFDSTFFPFGIRHLIYFINQISIYETIINERGPFLICLTFLMVWKLLGENIH